MLFSLDDPQLTKGAAIILERMGHQLADPGNSAVDIRVRTVKVDYDTVEINLDTDGAAVLRGRQTAHFFRGLSLLASQASMKHPVRLTEDHTIEHVGAMLDCSRNAVFTVKTIGSFIEHMAMFGMSELFLYMEDVYEVDNHPYFGYMRGRYTREELQEIEAIGETFGIEVIPCIQTLGHLKNALRWNYASGLKDTEDILLVDEEAVYNFIECLLTDLSATFRTRKIHLGMDEAYALGLGKYLKKHGYRESTFLMNRHLERIRKICQELSLEPMIWSDMYFRPHSPTGEYYHIHENTDFSAVTEPPEGISLVYWDYYHLDPDFYSRFIRLHSQLSPNPAFAGGGWTWNGIAPNYRLAEAVTRAGLSACRDQHINRAFCTLWFDNGAETPLEAALPSLALFAAYSCGASPEEAYIRDHFHACTGISWETFQLLDRFDALPGTPPHNAASDNPSKWFLYQDPLLGLFDTYAEEPGIAEHYKELNRILPDPKTGRPAAAQLFAYYKTLASVLSVKFGLGKDIKKAYDAEDRESLSRIAFQTIPSCIIELQKLRNLRRSLWLTEAKPFGYEVIDIRLAGVTTRLEYAASRLETFITGTVTRLEELEEKRLPFIERPAGSSRKFCACNNWQEIVSASPL